MRRPKKGMRPQAEVVTEQEAETFWMEIFNIILRVSLSQIYLSRIYLDVDDDINAEVDGNVVVNFEKDEKH